jgi:hypothetical protein
MKTLNAPYSSVTSGRRYEVWFVRLGLADLSGAWWFRYLLMNPGRGGCAGNPRGMPVQVWATWFPQEEKPRSFIQGFPLKTLDLSAREEDSFHFRAGDNEIREDSCRGKLEVDGHRIAWELHYGSSFAATLSNKGWIGFSRTPHSDARFSGQIVFDGRSFVGDGFGVQGHNCGYRHRSFWTWAHAYFLRSEGSPATIEALLYEMPFGLVFRKAVLWHEGRPHVFRNLREISRSPAEFVWNFGCFTRDGLQVEAVFDGSGSSLHRLPYVKTDCSGNFEVVNNSLAKATLRLKRPDGRVEELRTDIGAVLEMTGRPFLRK